MAGEVNRDLVITSPLTEGDDVLELHLAHNRLAAGYGLPRLPATPVFGGPSLSIIRGQAGVVARRGTLYYLGAEDRFMGKGHPLEQAMQEIVRDPTKRTAAQKARGKRRYIARRLELAWRGRDPRNWTQKQCVTYLLEQAAKGRLRGWSDLSTGSEIPARLRELRDRGVMWCPHRRAYHRVSIRLLRGHCRALRRSTFQVNAWSGGTHSFEGSHHYADPLTASDTEVDDEERDIEADFAVCGGRRNFETSHNHTDWP